MCGETFLEKLDNDPELAIVWRILQDFDDISYGEYNGNLFAIIDSVSTVHKIEARMADTHDDEELDSTDLWRYIEWGYSDEYALCCDCYTNIIRTSPDCWSWQPDYDFIDGEGYVCSECIDPEEYMESRVNNPESYANDALVDLDALHFVYIPIQLCNSMHGHNDKPEVVMNKLRKAQFDVTFTVLLGQFGVSFWAWVRETVGPNPEMCQRREQEAFCIVADYLRRGLFASECRYAESLGIVWEDGKWHTTD